MAGTGNTSIRSYDYWTTGTVTAVFSGTRLQFVDTTSGVHFLSTGIIVVNDGAGDLQISFDGTSVHGLIKIGEVITFDWRKKHEIWLRGIGGSTPDYRFWAW